MNSKERSLLFSTVATGLALIPTAYAAYVSNSIVLVADLIRCTIEFLAILGSLVVMRLIISAKKSSFSYGFGKIERLTGMSIAFVMLVSCVVVIAVAVHRLHAPKAVENVEFGLLLAVLSVIGNSSLWGYNLSLNKREYSPILDSQWRLFRAKTIAALIVLVSLVFATNSYTATWAEIADPVGSLALAGFLLYSATGIISSSMRDLLDRSLTEAVQLVIIKTLVAHEPHYKNLNRIRTRQSGADVFIEIALEFEGSLRLREVQNSIDAISAELYRELPGSKITIVPMVNGGEGL